MIIAILDDLLFTSKIRASAAALGVPLAVVRSQGAALDEMRKNAPALVILDLNSARTDPLGTVQAMKTDRALASVPTIGFVSHVQTELIEAARKAGVDEVMARSAFAGSLSDVLARFK